MKRTAFGTAGAAFLVALAVGGPAQAQQVKETICAQGTYSTPCPEVIRCPATNCGIGIPTTDGKLDIIYAAEKQMDGTSRRPIQAGSAMTLQNLIGKIVVFEYETSGDVGKAGADLPIKNIFYVIMPSRTSG